jgi:uncharacterized protein
MLLRFRVSNHRSIRDEQELSLVAVPRRGEPAPTGPIPPTVRVAAIYGANASGKSNVLHALDFFASAIRDSFAKWHVDGGVPRQPFLLDSAAKSRPSAYEVEIALEGVRYTYGFEVDNECVSLEWLYSYHRSQRRRTLFHRERENFHFGRSLTGPNNAIAHRTRKNALYLTVAAANDHEILGALYRKITDHLGVVIGLGRQGNLSIPPFASLALTDESFASQARAWLRIADLGIVDFELEKAVPTDEESRWWDNLTARSEAHDMDKETYELARDAYFGKLKLFHDHGSGNAPMALPFEAESAGTRIWLGMLVFVLGKLGLGRVLVVDEVDSSMHPRLSAALIQMFKDPEINPRGAQLIFTSHDVSLLGSLIEDEILARDEVWFTEKDRDGATALFPLSDFHPRRGENFERAYLQGRYGAVPYVDITDLRKVFADKDAS